MTTKQKEDFKNGFSIVHQWMTIIGFPVLLYLVGDMYSDFKRVRDSNIRQDERIISLEKQSDSHEQSINALSQYVFRGK